MIRANPFKKDKVDPEIEEGMLAEFKSVSQSRRGYDWSDDMWVAYNKMLERFPNRRKQVHDAYIALSAKLINDIIPNPKVYDEYRGKKINKLTGQEESI